MKLIKTLAMAAAVSLALIPGISFAAGGQKEAKSVDFSFEGPFGKFDRAQLQRGYQVYTEVCAACHSLKYLSYRNLSEKYGPGFSEAEVKAIAAQFEVIDGPNEEGDMFERPGIPSDRFVSPFPNVEAATAANGAYPPDLSLLAKGRAGYHGEFTQFFNGSGGPEYIYSVLTGFYEIEPGHTYTDDDGKEYDPVAKCEKSDKHFNEYFENGPCISMAPPLPDGAVEYTDGTEASGDQMAKDVSAFLMWAAEPTMTVRKATGFKVMIFLSIFTGLLWAAYQKMWKDVDH